MAQTIFLQLRKDDSLVDSLNEGFGSSKPLQEVAEVLNYIKLNKTTNLLFA